MRDIVEIFCLCDDYLSKLRFKDWCNVKWTSQEVMTCMVIAMKYFYGNIDRARIYLMEHGYIARSITLSALMKRIHKIPNEWWIGMLEFVHEWGKGTGLPLDYIVDSFPISVCRNIRIRNCRIFQGEDYRGYNASKREYFYGIKATVVTTLEGCPIRFILCPGCEHDITPFKMMSLNLPKGSTLYGDSAYTSKEHENERLINDDIRMVTAPKSNSKGEIAIEDYVNLKYHRRKIETAFSVITGMMPRKIHATTCQGFELKIIGFILAMATNFVCI